MALRPLLLTVLVLGLIGAPARGEDGARGELYRELLTCTPTGLVPSNKGSDEGLTLDLIKAQTDLMAASTERAFDLPKKPFHVTLTLSVSDNLVEITRSFVSKKSAEAAQAEPGRPMRLRLPLAPDSPVTLKSPGLEVVCRLKRTRIDPDCPECR